jgi:hypothetical protein
MNPDNNTDENDDDKPLCFHLIHPFRLRDMKLDSVHQALVPVAAADAG